MAGGFSAEGEARALASLEGAAERFRIGLADASHMAGQVLVRTVQAGMVGAAGGRAYNGKEAGAPGGYSAVRSGNLLGSADYEVSGANYLRFGVGMFYGVYQEMGTSKMAARPNLQKAVGESSGEVTNLLGQVTFRRIIGG